MVSPSWTRSSSALFALTDGIFDPRKDAVRERRLTSQGEGGGLKIDDVKVDERVDF